MKHGEYDKDQSQHTFTRMFPDPQLPFSLGAMDPENVAYEVGKHMISECDTNRESETPAGYTYFGQFIDHDITRDITPDAGDSRPIATEDLQQGRSPCLDLDSVYGKPSEEGGESPRSDGVKFDLGFTKPQPKDDNKKLQYDLPRKGCRVLIPDERNDENLVVAQMHALWMKFHNHVAEALETKFENHVNEALKSSKANKACVNKVLFKETRELVIRHYQYIVLHDFLKRFVDADVFTEVIKEGKPKYFHVVNGKCPPIPIEFSVAAFRFGHSLVRKEYDWNMHFNEKTTRANFAPPPSMAINYADPKKEKEIKEEFLFSLFKFTTKGGLSGANPLPTTWIPNWRFLFDLSDGKNDQKPQKTMNIDPFLSMGLDNIRGDNNTFNLAAKNLLRGHLRGLACGQDIAKLMGLEPLSAKQMSESLGNEKLGESVKKYGFHIRTPLWLYILQEAKIQGDGEKLGAVGSRIVCETFRSLIMGSEISILRENWHPKHFKIRGKNDKCIATMSDVLWFIDEKEPIINPLEDERLASDE